MPFNIYSIKDIEEWSMIVLHIIPTRGSFGFERD